MTLSISASTKKASVADTITFLCSQTSMVRECWKSPQVAVDMWQAFENSATIHVLDAEIVHDRFHISKHLNDAIDKVCRQEHKALMQEGDDTLKGSRQLWLFHPENLQDAQWERFDALKELELKTSRAWAIREQFRWF